MKKKYIELFCGVDKKIDMYLNCKTAWCLYSIFVLFFVIIVALIDYFKTKEFFLLIISSPFLFFAVLFKVWLCKIRRKNKSYLQYVLFEGTVTLATSFIWLFTAFINIYSNRLGFSMLYICGIFLGFIFAICFFFVRFFKWKSYKRGIINERKQPLNVKITCALIVLFVFCLNFIKKLTKIYLYRMLASGLFVLFFIFLTIAINLLVNYYVLKDTN